MALVEHGLPREEREAVDRIAAERKGPSPAEPDSTDRVGGDATCERLAAGRIVAVDAGVGPPNVIEICADRHAVGRSKPASRSASSRRRGRGQARTPRLDISRASAALAPLREDSAAKAVRRPQTGGGPAARNLLPMSRRRMLASPRAPTTRARHRCTSPSIRRSLPRALARRRDSR